MNLPDLEIRIQQLLDDELSEQQFAELETELLENPEAMDLYLSYSGLQSDLRHHGDYRKTAEKIPVVPVEELLAQQRRRAIRISLLSAAAILIIMAVIMWMQNVPAAPDTLATVRATPGTEFILTHETGNDRPSGNVMVENSRITIRHGVVELDLPHDVLALVEGPAEVCLLDERTLELSHGRAYFKVSSAEGHGFTVVTPHQRIVDLGTAFGIDCQNGRADVELHVMEGQVRVDSLKNDKGEVINAPRAVLLSGTKTQPTPVELNTAFLQHLPPKIDLLLDENFETGLVANRDYVIEMDPTVIRDLAGNRFHGIGKDSPWKFTTASTVGTVRNFSFEQNTSSGGMYVAHWPEVTGTGKMFNTAIKKALLKPTHGKNHLMITGDHGQTRVLAQDLGCMITAGTTYRLTVDVGTIEDTSGAQGFIRLFGSDTGYQTALAETTLSPPANQWLRDRTLTFTATEAHATGQTLGIALGSMEGRVIFDNVRLMPIRQISALAKSIAQSDMDPTSSEDVDSAPPAITKLHPANNATGVTPGDHLTITFNEPIQLGTGRIFLRSVNDRSDTELVVGDPRISIDGRKLIIIPPADLEDGTTQLGRIHGWDSDGWVGIFNPDGKGGKYDHDDLNDQEKSQGVIRAMRGPVMATLSTLVPGTEIRRNIGTIAENRHYSISAAIGVRAENAETSSFPGYTIRLMSGDTTLAVRSSNTPPGPTSSVQAVGFSWDSSRLPEGIHLGDPLTIAIHPNQSESAGFLDLDSIRISVIDQSGKK